VGIVHTLPLETLRGQHMATICLDDFDGLSPFTGTPRDSGPEREFVFMVGDELASGRLALYINGGEPSFAANCLLTLTLNRWHPAHYSGKARRAPPLGCDNHRRMEPPGSRLGTPGLCISARRLSRASTAGLTSVCSRQLVAQ
jgi:hypothetical protein